MEGLEELEELNPQERTARFHRIMKAVIGVDSLFPPEDGVREPARPPRPVNPKIGHIALELDQKVLIAA